MCNVGGQNFRSGRVEKNGKGYVEVDMGIWVK